MSDSRRSPNKRSLPATNHPRSNLDDRKAKGPHADPSDKSSDDEEQNQRKKKKKSDQKNSHNLLRKDALQAGKWFTVQHALWTDPATVRYVALLKKDRPTDNQLDELEDGDEMRVQAVLIYKTLPAHLHPHVEEGWFTERVR